jgi:predicted nucleic acid-binding protein
MIALDSSAVIDLLNGDSNILQKLKKHPRVAISRLTYFEVLCGLRDTQRFIATEFFSHCLIFELDTESAEVAARLFYELRKKGKEIDSFDCLIAGTLLIQNCAHILTRNKKHFSRISELKVEDY